MTSVHRPAVQRQVGHLVGDDHPVCVREVVQAQRHVAVAAGRGSHEVCVRADLFGQETGREGRVRTSHVLFASGDPRVRAAPQVGQQHLDELRWPHPACPHGFERVAGQLVPAARQDADPLGTGQIAAQVPAGEFLAVAHLPHRQTRELPRPHRRAQGSGDRPAGRALPERNRPVALPAADAFCHRPSGADQYVLKSFRLRRPLPPNRRWQRRSPCGTATFSPVRGTPSSTTHSVPG